VQAQVQELQQQQEQKEALEALSDNLSSVPQQVCVQQKDKVCVCCCEEYHPSLYAILCAERNGARYPHTTLTCNHARFVSALSLEEDALNRVRFTARATSMLALTRPFPTSKVQTRKVWC